VMASVIDEIFEKVEAAEDDEEEDVDEGGVANLDGEKKKKKKKKKKKSKAKNRVLSGGIWDMPQHEFDAMCKKWLTETNDQVDGLDEKTMNSMPKEFAGYSFASDLRPHYVTKQMKVKPGIPLPEYHETGIATAELNSKKSGTIPVHDAKDIERMREICAIGREVLDIGARFLKAGVTGDEIDRVVYSACMERGVYPSPLNYNNFPKSLCVSVNEVICHGIPDCRKVREGDIVNLDISVFKDGYHSDLNETFLIGKCDEASENLVKTAYESLRKASELIMEGTLYRELGPVISKTAAQNGCTVVRTYCGHGVGKNFHQAPNVPHYAKNKAIGIMRPGHIFTAEPMINIGANWGDTLWPDSWTAPTRDGARSAQFEHTFLINEEGKLDILTAKPGTSSEVMMPWDPERFRR